MEHIVRIQWQALWRELREAKMSATDVVPELDGIHPQLVLSEDARRRAKETLDSCTPANRRGQPVVLMISGGKLLPVHNREWGLVNYQALTDALAPYATVIQVGGDGVLQKDGRPLANLGGRPIRETGALFACADAVLLQEGGLHHLARAVEAPSVVLFGGTVLPEQTGYDRQVNLARRTTCSPCLAERKNCTHLKCMVTFTPRYVAKALANVLAEHGKSLPEEAIAATPDRWIPPDFVDPAHLERELAENGAQHRAT
jgi:ADP-heptose:LPS heptosyltransferase